jgi:hypothetical protein
MVEAMEEKWDKSAKRTIKQTSTTSAGSTSAQIVGDGNTIIQHHGDRGGKVVAVYMRGSDFNYEAARMAATRQRVAQLSWSASASEE